jgi:hypothetical protein
MSNPVTVPFDPETLLPFPPSKGAELIKFEGLLWAVKDGSNVFMDVAEPGASAPAWVKSTESAVRIVLGGNLLAMDSLKDMYPSRDDMP